MTPLRQRMIHDLQLRNRASGTIKAYVGAAARFARHFGRSPQQLSGEHVRQYLLHLMHRRKASWGQYNVTRCALQFLYGVTLGRSDEVEKLPWAQPPRRLPTVLSVDEVRRMMDVTSRQPRDKALLMTLYGAGLRIAEALALRVADIDTPRMLIHVRGGKGNKDRMVKMSPALLAALRDAWRARALKHSTRRASPTPVGPPPKDSPDDTSNDRPLPAAAARLFPRNGRPGESIDRKTAYHIVKRAAKRAGITRRVSPHTMRHSYATHLLEAGADLRTIQALLGHAYFKSTTLYLHLSQAALDAAPSLLDRLYAPPTAPTP